MVSRFTLILIAVTYAEVVIHMKSTIKCSKSEVVNLAKAQYLNIKMFEMTTGCSFGFICRATMETQLNLIHKYLRQ